MKKFFTSLIMLCVAMVSWADPSFKVTHWDEANKVVTITYVADPNNTSFLQSLADYQNEDFKRALDCGPGKTYEPKVLDQATTVKLVGPISNYDFTPEGKIIEKLLKVVAKDNKKVFLDLSECTEMYSKVVPQQGEYNANIDWTTTKHRFAFSDAVAEPVEKQVGHVVETTTKWYYITADGEVAMAYDYESQNVNGPDDNGKYHYNGQHSNTMGGAGNWEMRKEDTTKDFWYYGKWSLNDYPNSDYYIISPNDVYDITDVSNQGNLIQTGKAMVYPTVGTPLDFTKIKDYINGVGFPNDPDFNYIPADLCKGYSGLTKVTFGSYTEWIGERAFQETYLEQPTFPATMKVFDGDCFKNAMANPLFTTVDLSGLSKIQIVDYMAFGSEDGKVSNLATFTLPTSKNTSLKYFANYVIRGSKVEELNFTNCEGIYNFAHDGQATFEEFSPNWSSYWTFYNCPKLETIILPPNLRYVTKDAFNTCPSLQTVTFLGDAVYNKSTCVEGGTNTITNPLIIDENAFKDNTNLTTVNFCNRVTEIRTQAFQKTGLTSVHIPASVEKIGNKAFSECTEMTTVYFDEIDSDCAPCKHAKLVIEGEHPANKDVNGDGIINNEDRVGDGNGAFFNCKKITDVYVNAVNADITCENKVFDYEITFGQSDPKGNFATLHYPEGEESKYVNLDHYLTDEIAHTPGLFQKWLLDHFNYATIPNNNGFHEFINSGPTPEDIEEPPFRDGDMFLRTYSDPNYARIVPKGVKAYIVKGLAKDNTTGEVSLVLQSISVIPKQTGVILFGQPNANFETEKTENGQTITVSGKILSMTAVEFEPGQGIPLRRDYWGELNTEVTEEQYKTGIRVPDSERMKNYLMPIIDGANILNSDGETTTATNLLTVSPYEYVMKNGKKEITFRNFSLWRFGQTKNLAHSEEFEGTTFGDANDYRGFFRTIKNTYNSGYAYLHLSASEYTKPDGAECIVIKDNDYTVEYDGSSYVDFSTITNPTDNPNELWKYAKWNNIPKGWGVRDNIRNASTGAGSVLYLGEFEDEADGIMNVVAPTTEDNAYYTLQGVKVSHPTKGIYIHKGKKVIIK